MATNSLASTGRRPDPKYEHETKKSNFQYFFLNKNLLDGVKKCADYESQI